jgi:hypothetical protein
MKNENEELATRVAEKEAHIQRHKEMLLRNLGSRWFDQSRRRLEELESELKELQSLQEE